jgi:hypothetical protein
MNPNMPFEINVINEFIAWPVKERINSNLQ